MDAYLISVRTTAWLLPLLSALFIRLLLRVGLLGFRVGLLGFRVGLLGFRVLCGYLLCLRLGRGGFLLFSVRLFSLRLRSSRIIDFLTAAGPGFLLPVAYSLEGLARFLVIKPWHLTCLLYTSDAAD